MKKVLKRIGIVIGIIILLFCGVVGYFVYKDLKEEEVLKKEIINLSNMDLLEDNYTITIKTSGDYAYVENAVKKFYKQLSDNVKALNFALDNEELINILSLDNLEKDRPNFEHSYQLVSSVKEKANNAIFNISSLCDEKTIKNLLDSKKVDQYYIDFYEKLMYTEQDLKYFAETKEEMESMNNNLNLFLDKIVQILDMLKKNNDFWFIEKEQIYFERQELVDEYNQLYKELKDIASTKLDGYHYSGVTPNDANV